MSDETLDHFARAISGSEMRLNVSVEALREPRRPAKTDALFHLPLLALCTLLISKMGALTTEQLGRRIAHLLIEHFHGLRNVETLEWSMTLRRRCAEALAFLEAARLVEVGEDACRFIVLTTEGKAVISRALRHEDDVGLLARGLLRAQSKARLRAGAI
jgi:hypothetical protein